MAAARSSLSASATTFVTESLELLIDAGDSVHAFPYALQRGCGPRLALGSRIAADQLEDWGKPLLRQLIHQLARSGCSARISLVAMPSETMATTAARGQAAPAVSYAKDCSGHRTHTRDPVRVWS